MFDSDTKEIAGFVFGACVLVVVFALTIGAAVAAFIAPILLTWQWSTGGG